VELPHTCSGGMDERRDGPPARKQTLRASKL
jgi:hypothetical protein